MRRVQVLLLLNERSNLEQLEGELSQVVASLSRSIPTGITVVASVALADDPSPRTVLGQRVIGSASHRFHGMITLDSTTHHYDVLFDLLVGVILPLAEVSDLNRSAAVAGEVHLIVPGDDRLLFIYTLRRRPELSHAEFLDYWLNVHSDHGRVAPGLHGYRQLHGDVEATVRACRRLGLGITDLDGVAESANSDIPNFIEVMSTSITAGVGTDDTSAFIDQTRSAVFLTRVLTPVSEVTRS